MADSSALSAAESSALVPALIYSTFLDDLLASVSFLAWISAILLFAASITLASSSLMSLLITSLTLA
jgi:hypothetical protein